MQEVYIAYLMSERKKRQCRRDANTLRRLHNSGFSLSEQNEWFKEIDR